MPRYHRLIAAAGLLAVSFCVLYWAVMVKLASDWVEDPNYSHGFFIVPLAVFFAWERRAALAAAPVRPTYAGLLVMAGAIGVLLAGLLGAELFLSRISMLGVIAGIILFLFGWRHLRLMAFPVAFLLLMIPIPAIIFNQIAFPLQLLASRFGETVLSAAHIPVLREGNVIILSNTSLEVAQACSGIRSLVSLLTLGIVYGHFVDRRASMRLLLAIATVPVAVLTNGIRVASTGIAAHYYGPEAAEGFLHESAGLIVFAAAFMILFALERLLRSLWPEGGRAQTPAATAVSVP
jgi:exosortase